MNLGFYKDRTREWVSVSGTAFVTDDRAKIHQLYLPDWKAWFDDQGMVTGDSPDIGEVHALSGKKLRRKS